MNSLHSIVTKPSDFEKQAGHCLDGYTFSAENGFRIGRDKGNIIEVLEIEGQQFRRNIPPPPLYSHNNASYVPSDPLQFPCVNYEDRFVVMGVVEENRILEIRLCNFRKQAAELKELAKNLKTNQEKIAELTSSGDLASCFEIHEKTNDFTKKATELASSLTDNDECNTLLINTLEYKMKAAGEISEYEQAQMLKNAMETYKSSLEAIKGKANPTVQMIVAYSDSLDLSLKLSNYLTE